ncbi:MAG: M28 family peptidase [Bacteroidales bacterium]
MKNIFTTLIFSLIFIKLFASGLVFIPTSDFNETRNLFKNPSVKVHFYRNEFVIATIHHESRKDFVILDSDPWHENISYYLVYYDENTNKDSYISEIVDFADVLYDGDHFLIIKINETLNGQLTPAKNDGMIRLFDREARLPLKRSLPAPAKTEPKQYIVDLLDEIDGSFITNRVQHMEDYGTRNAYTPESVEAQQWIEEQFLDWGLAVETMDFTMPGGPASDNVIATLTGTKYPDEYVVVGGHYDSVSSSGDAPGADDNASGTSGVMEIARILSQYEFDRSIIFCAFSGEEYGLYGSAAYANQSAQQEMDILGYFNMDMIGYLYEGNLGMKTSLIYPQSAQELADFYTEVTSVYLPAFQVETGNLIGGDSDHTSFNNNGYMGIFPFEDVDNYSPYIHTSNDVVGPSYNNELLAVTFTKAALASLVTMANMLNPPRNLVAVPGNGKVTLQWDSMEDIDNFKVYRDGNYLAETTNTSYIDNEVENGTQYEYYVTAIYSDTGDESDPSNRVLVTPMPPIEFPLFIDFENGAPYWEMDESWGTSTTHSYSPSHSLTESPTGQYENNREDYATLSPLNLMGYTNATLSFYTRYDIENNWDYMYLEISTNGTNWTTLDTFTGTQSSWVQKTYSLSNYLNHSFVLIRFHFSSDYTVTRDGMYIDDFQITTEGGYDRQWIDIPAGWSGLSSMVAPAQGQVTDIMQPIDDELVILQSLDGAYWPGHNINTLGTWDSHSGYKVKVSEGVTLEISGYFEGNTEVTLSAGWNIMPVLSLCPTDAGELFSGSLENITLVKEIAGNRVFWPAMDIHTLEEFIPGRAYLVYTTQEFSFYFPDCDPDHKPATGDGEKRATPWNNILPTGNSHAIAIPHSILDEFAPDDIIGAFTADGLFAGSVTLVSEPRNLALTVFANDSLTEQQDGFLPGEEIFLRLYESSSGEEFHLITVFDESMPHTGTFAFEGISALTGLSIDDTGIAEYPRNTRIFPNPAQEQISISLQENQQAELTISDISGKIYFTGNIHGKEEIDLAGFAPGVYIFRLSGKDFTEFHKVIIR